MERAISLYVTFCVNFDRFSVTSGWAANLPFWSEKEQEVNINMKQWVLLTF